jgi:hypothetical protein
MRSTRAKGETPQNSLCRSVAFSEALGAQEPESQAAGIILALGFRSCAQRRIPDTQAAFLSGLLPAK